MQNETITHQQATALIEEYFALQTEKAAIDERMKAKKETLRLFAEANKEKFTEGTYDLDCCGYLRFGTRSVVKTKRTFSLLNVVKTFPQFLKKEFSVSAIKAALDDARQRKKVSALGLSIVTVTEFELVRKDMEPEEIRGDYNRHEEAERMHNIQRNLK